MSEKIIRPQDGSYCGRLYLTTDCFFRDIFSGPKKRIPEYGIERPVSEVCFVRADYNGNGWRPYWVKCQYASLDLDLLTDSESYFDSLLKTPEFHDLQSVHRLCEEFAEPTSDPTEFNIYSKCDFFNIWLRLITREGDHNLYCHFYEKKQAG